MNSESLNNDRQGSPPLAEEEANLLDYFQVLAKWRRFIFFSVFLTCGLVAAISLLLPKRYTAQASILPSEEKSSKVGLSALISNAPLASFGPGGFGGGSAELFVEMLQSRTVADKVIDRLGLMAVFEAEDKEEARRLLKENTTVKASKAGVVTVEVEAGTPALAARIANTYVEELDRVNTQKNITRAKGTRIFIEERLKQAKADLKGAEEDFLAFQEEHKTIALEEQTKAAIEAAAQVKAEIITREVERDVLKRSLYATHPRILELQARIDELNKRLEQMEYGNRGSTPLADLSSVDPSSESSPEFYLPFSKIPSLGLQLARLTREVKVQTAVFELLTQQYEQAKIQEARDTPTVQVLDEAVPPILRSWPKRTLMVMVSGVFALFISVFLSFTFEYIHRMKSQEETRQQLESITTAFKEDYQRIKQLGRSGNKADR